MFRAENSLEIPEDFYDKKSVIYKEGQHAVNIRKNVHELRILEDPYTSVGYGFDFFVPEGYRLVNSFTLGNNDVLFVLVNDVPVVVEKSDMKNTINIGIPYINNEIKLTKKY